MSLPTEAVEGLIDLISHSGRIDRNETRVVVETAIHAASEAMEAAARVCTALDRPEHVVVALTLAMKVVQMTAKVEAQAIKELAGDMLSKHRTG